MRQGPKIPLVAWRDGRPRFSPGPKLRALGFKGEDLKDDAGRWLAPAAARRWAEARAKEIAAVRADPKRRPPAPRVAGLATIEDLFEALFKSKKLRSAGEAGALQPKTAQDYRLKAQALAKFDPELYTGPAAALTRAAALGLHEAMWEEKGLAMANGVMAVLRLAYSAAADRGDGLANPCLKLKLPPLAPRVRVAAPQEIDALMAAADGAAGAGAGEADLEIGDAILLALYTGQRQGDVLSLEERAEAQGRIRFIQAKTGARVRLRALPQLVERLAAARLRRIVLAQKFAAVATTVVVDSHTGQSFNGHTFRHRFAAVRARAAASLPSVATLLFLDLRDTAITRLANAGATIPEIAAVSGHSLATIDRVLKHYLELNEEQADAGIDKLEAWMAKGGVKL